MSNSTDTSAKPMLDSLLVNAVVNSTTEVLSTMAATAVTLKQIVPNKDYTSSGDMSAIIGIVGEGGEGMVAISFHYPLANTIVSRLLGCAPEEVSKSDCCDGIGELVNMISGSAKSILSNQTAGSPYKLSLPTIIQGQGHSVSNHKASGPYLFAEFETDEGEIFTLQVTFMYITAC